MSSSSEPVKPVKPVWRRAGSADLISVAEAAQILGCSNSTIYKLIRDEMIDAETISKSRFPYRISVYTYRDREKLRQQQESRAPRSFRCTRTEAAAMTVFLQAFRAAGTSEAQAAILRALQGAGTGTNITPAGIPDYG